MSEKVYETHFRPTDARKRRCSAPLFNSLLVFFPPFTFETCEVHQGVLSGLRVSPVRGPLSPHLVVHPVSLQGGVGGPSEVLPVRRSRLSVREGGGGDGTSDAVAVLCGESGTVRRKGGVPLLILFLRTSRTDPVSPLPADREGPSPSCGRPLSLRLFFVSAWGGDGGREGAIPCIPRLSGLRVEPNRPEEKTQEERGGHHQNRRTRHRHAGKHGGQNETRVEDAGSCGDPEDVKRERPEEISSDRPNSGATQ
mmetsp:Transcript_11645/g.22366  ORF Transcript_11645/g.22366 Transcript_11645/m.22366 type:complete len:253 (-) Transcript_11645:1056-1814(-)